MIAQLPLMSPDSSDVEPFSCHLPQTRKGMISRNSAPSGNLHDYIWQRQIKTCCTGKRRHGLTRNVQLVKSKFYIACQ